MLCFTYFLYDRISESGGIAPLSWIGPGWFIELIFHPTVG